jgi:hypothetical protein
LRESIEQAVRGMRVLREDTPDKRFAAGRKEGR